MVNGETSNDPGGMAGGQGAVPYGRRAEDSFDELLWRAVVAADLGEVMEAYLRMVDVAGKITATVRRARLAGHLKVQPDVTVEGRPTLHVWATDHGLKQITRLWEVGMARWLLRQVQRTLDRALPGRAPGPPGEPRHPPDDQGASPDGGDAPRGEHAA